MFFKVSHSSILSRNEYDNGDISTLSTPRISCVDVQYFISNVAPPKVDRRIFEILVKANKKGNLRTEVNHESFQRSEIPSTNEFSAFSYSSWVTVKSM